MNFEAAFEKALHDLDLATTNYCAELGSTQPDLFWLGYWSGSITEAVRLLKKLAEQRREMTRG